VLFPLAQAPTLLYFVEKCILAVAYMKPCIGKGLGVNFWPRGWLHWPSLDIVFRHNLQWS